MKRLLSVRALMGRLALAGAAAMVLLVGLSPGTAMAFEVHHVLPEPGSALATAPDHLEVMFDEELRPGLVQIGISPDATNVPIALPAVIVESNLAVQPLPPLATGAYTAGFRVLGQDGLVHQGTFGFTVGTATGPPAAVSSGDQTPPDRSWLVTVVAAGLVLPAAAATVLPRLRRRRNSTVDARRVARSRS